MRGNDAIGQVLGSVGGYLTTMATGPFQVGLAPVIASPAWTLDLNNIADTDIAILANPDTDKGLPAYRTILKYGRSWTVQGGENGQIAPGASAARRGYAQEQWRTVKDERVAVLTTYLLSPELTIETLMTSSADAATEVTRRANLYAVLRQVVEVQVDLLDADAMTLGSTVAVSIGRYGWTPKNFVVIARDDDFGAGQTRLTLWG